MVRFGLQLFLLASGSHLLPFAPPSAAGMPVLGYYPTGHFATASTRTAHSALGQLPPDPTRVRRPIDASATAPVQIALAAQVGYLWRGHQERVAHHLAGDDHYERAAAVPFNVGRGLPEELHELGVVGLGQHAAAVGATAVTATAVAASGAGAGGGGAWLTAAVAAAVAARGLPRRLRRRRRPGAAAIPALRPVLPVLPPPLLRRRRCPADEICVEAPRGCPHRRARCHAGRHSAAALHAALSGDATAHARGDTAIGGAVARHAGGRGAATGARACGMRRRCCSDARMRTHSMQWRRKEAARQRPKGGAGLRERSAWPRPRRRTRDHVAPCAAGAVAAAAADAAAADPGAGARGGGREVKVCLCIVTCAFRVAESCVGGGGRT
eukprot:260352-Chlamydomonas_euryale.AAC.2